MTPVDAELAKTHARCRTRRATLPLLRQLALLAACLTASTGCQTTSLRRTAPGFPWKTQATSRQHWQMWGEQNIESGDILFVRGESRILLGLVNFSKLVTEMTDSPFSHVALAAREGGELIVYDTVRDGPRRMSFAEFVADRRAHVLAVKRLKPQYRHHIPEAIEYCAYVWKRRVPFDESFRLDNNRLYCSEMIEFAFQHAGLNLSRPLPISELPGYDNLSTATRGLVQAATPIRPDQMVFVPGNEAIGLWASPALELVLDASDLRLTPEENGTVAPDAGMILPAAFPALAD